MTTTGTYGYGRAATLVKAADGLVSLPSIAFASDPDTGFYRISSGKVGFASDGVLSLTLGAGGLIQGALATTSLILAGAADSAAQRDVVIQTNNAAGTGLVTRATIGSNAATTVLTLANVTVTGLVLSGGLTTGANWIVQNGTGIYQAAANLTWSVSGGGGIGDGSG